MLFCLSGLGFGLVVEEMMSWWKAKKKRRLEAEFRRNTIRLHEGSKKTETEKSIKKLAWGRRMSKYYIFFFWKQKFYSEFLFCFRRIFKSDRNLKLMFDSSIFEALSPLFYLKLFPKFHHNRLFPHLIFWRNFNAAVWINEKMIKTKNPWKCWDDRGTFLNLCEL